MRAREAREVLGVVEVETLLGVKRAERFLTLSFIFEEEKLLLVDRIKKSHHQLECYKGCFDQKRILYHSS